MNGNGSENRLKLSVGPLLFGWPPSKIRDTWLMLAADSKADILYLGEVVCSKRCTYDATWLADLARELRRSGKEVVLSTLAMPTTEYELQFIRDIVAAAKELDLCIEANDMAAVHIASEAKLAFVAGPHLNVYSHGTLQQLCRLGARRVVLPPEIPAANISAIIGDADVEVEYFAHGRLPLTFSARCYTARARGLSKQECGRICFQTPDGLEMRTMDGGDFATINGIQIMSHKPFTAINHLPALAEQGVQILRLSPQADDTMETIRHFRAVTDGARSPEEALREMSGGSPGSMFCNGYYFGRQGRLWIDG